MDTKVIHENEFLVDDIEDELEDFKEIGGSEVLVDPDALQWEEDWDVAGWDDEDTDADFVSRLHEELERYKASLNGPTESAPKTTQGQPVDVTQNTLHEESNATKTI